VPSAAARDVTAQLETEREEIAGDDNSSFFLRWKRAWLKFPMEFWRRVS
jgi:hypothetical protein